jgi:hypothetical protein
VLDAAGQVLRHFDLLLSQPWNWPPGTRRPFVRQRARVVTFLETMRRSPPALESYVDALNTLKPKYVWWWAIANPELEGMWNRSH